MMAAAQRGEFSVIIVWQLSRLWRNRVERAEGIEILRRAGVSVYACKGPDLDLSTAYGRGMAGMLGEVDTMEVEIKGERTEAAQRQAAEAGLWLGGSRPFGWRLLPDPARAGRPNAHRRGAPGGGRGRGGGGPAPGARASRRAVARRAGARPERPRQAHHPRRPVDGGQPARDPHPAAELWRRRLPGRDPARRDVARDHHRGRAPEGLPPARRPLPPHLGR